jgi:CheY-like chemotaxis protein
MAVFSPIYHPSFILPCAFYGNAEQIADFSALKEDDGQIRTPCPSHACRTPRACRLLQEGTASPNMTLFVPRLPYQPFNDMGGASGGAVQAGVDMSELFTTAARQVISSAAKKSQTFSFDFRGPMPWVAADGVQVHCGLHRLLWGVVDSLQSGFVLFSAEVAEVDAVRCRITVTAAGTGEIGTEDRIDHVLQRLELFEGPRDGHRPAGHRAAKGICPNTRAPVEFSCMPHEGVLFRTELVCELARPCAPATEHAHAERAWLVGPDDVAAQALNRRLQRLGWAMSRFDTCAQAVAHLPHATGSHPALVVVAESDGAVPSMAQHLRAKLPAATRLVLAAMPGSPTLRTPGAIEGYEVRLQPLSPGELLSFTQERTPSAQLPSGDTFPAPLAWEDRPLVLIVDDTEINLIVARGLVEALGYEVRTATDGADAVAQCRRVAPRVVLMDVDMPVMNGIDATRRLRELQRTGRIPPFPIVGATAGGVLASAEECMEAGMDGYLPKPLHIAQLQQELRRIATLR